MRSTVKFIAAMLMAAIMLSGCVIAPYGYGGYDYYGGHHHGYGGYYGGYRGGYYGHR